VLESVKTAIKTGLGKITARIKPFEYKDDLVNYVNEKFERRRAERRPFELQWRLNMAFVDGQQYLDINSARLDLMEIPKLYDWQEREVFNHIAPIVETRIARISRMQPTLKTRPATGEPEDLSSAKVSNRILNYALNEYLDQNKRYTLTQWLDVCGTAFLKNIWNAKKGRVVGATLIRAASDDAPREERKPKEEDEGLETAGKRIAEEITPESEEEVVVEKQENGVVAGTIQPIYEGDIEPVVVPSYEVFPDSSWHPTMDEVRSILHARAYHVDQVYEFWGVRVEPEPVESFSLQRAATGFGGLGYNFGSFYARTAKMEGYVLVKELWEKPSLSCPQGRLIVVANDKLLFTGPLPYLVGQDGAPDLPFVKFDAIRRPGCFWGRSVIERLIPVQRRYNALRNRKAEYLNRCAIGQYVVEEGSVDMDDLEENGGAPGYIHVYKRGFNSPQYMQNPPLPNEFETEEATLLNEFTIISGVSEIARHSDAPPGVKSGIALSIAVEQDDTRLSHTVGNIETGLVHAGKQWLRLYRQYATEKRLHRTVGSDLEIELIQWDASDIRSDDVVIETSALLAETPAQRRQMVFDLLNAGLFNDPETGRLTKEGRAKVFELLQFGHWEFTEDIDKLHISRAERENQQMAQGALPLVKDYDSHVIHLQRHTKFRLQSEYEQLNQQTNSAVDEIFRQHTEMHLAALQRMAMAQQMAAQPQAENQEG